VGGNQFLTSGCDPSGTIKVPIDFSTIQAAIDWASAGAVIEVGIGTYNEAIDLKGKAITVAASGSRANTIIDGSLNLSETAGTIIDGSLNLLWPMTSVFMLPIQSIATSSEFKRYHYKERGDKLNTVVAIESYLQRSSFSLVDLFTCQGYDADTEHLIDKSLVDSSDARSNILRDILFKRPASTKACNGYLNFKRRRKERKTQGRNKKLLKLILVENEIERYLLDAESVIDCESPSPYHFSVWKSTRK
jgi:hypothetical protein